MQLQVQEIPRLHTAILDQGKELWLKKIQCESCTKPTPMGSVLFNAVCSLKVLVINVLGSIMLMSLSSKSGQHQFSPNNYEHGITISFSFYVCFCPSVFL